MRFINLICSFLRRLFSPREVTAAPVIIVGGDQFAAMVLKAVGENGRAIKAVLERN